ncbi:hypothetical protein SLEP1_g4017 [Rubroshorea leprosula]|uniref:F-box associated beta-propeller type 1 domain-containing protein n=1 Tax=Rubroshorea leprosula TaxID=152421 RepID=A0AAV5HXT7_9ROSI|nr:hypothetical protein SLEP1_g4017 [Rubroshorea leprosula]
MFVLPPTMTFAYFSDTASVPTNMITRKDHQYAESWGSCDGIVFFFDSSYMRDTIVIANPVIGEYRILPESCICLPLPALYHGDDNEDYLARVVDAVGLGYDLKSNDYKILRVWEIESYNYSRQRFPQRAEVYTFSTNSWREINNFAMEVEIDNVVMEACFTPMPSFDRYWNGAYYWFVFCYERAGDTIRKHLIALFDMSDEVVRYIGLPKSCEEPNDNATMFYSLIELNGSLTLFHYPFQVQEKPFDIWGMDKFGVNGTWTKILCIGPLLGIETPLLFGKDDELLMENIEVQLASRFKRQYNHYPWKSRWRTSHFGLVVDESFGSGNRNYTTLIRWILSSQKRESASAASEGDSFN